MFKCHLLLQCQPQMPFGQQSQHLASVRQVCQSSSIRSREFEWNSPRPGCGLESYAGHHLAHSQTYLCFRVQLVEHVQLSKLTLWFKCYKKNFKVCSCLHGSCFADYLSHVFERSHASRMRCAVSVLFVLVCIKSLLVEPRGLCVWRRNAWFC